MIGNLTFDSLCEMVLNERVARFPYIKMEPEVQEELEKTLTEKEQTFYNVTIPNTVKRGLRIKKVMGASEIDFEEPISEMDTPSVQAAKQLYLERVKMYREVFLNIKHVINNLPEDPNSPGTSVPGLRINELFSTSVSPMYKVKKLQMNQFKNFVSGLTKSTDTIKWSGAVEAFVPGSAEADMQPRSVDPSSTEQGPEEDDDSVSDKEYKYGGSDIPVLDDDLGDRRPERIPALGDDDYWESLGLDDDDEKYDDNALGIDSDIDDAYNELRRSQELDDY